MNWAHNVMDGASVSGGGCRQWFSVVVMSG